MSLHAPSHIVSDNSEGCVSSDSTSEIERQIQFMDEKETVLIARMVDVQKERVCIGPTNCEQTMALHYRLLSPNARICVSPIEVQKWGIR